VIIQKAHDGFEELTAWRGLHLLDGDLSRQEPAPMVLSRLAGLGAGLGFFQAFVEPSELCFYLLNLVVRSWTWHGAPPLFG
jgi:hypothetical protein